MAYRKIIKIPGYTRKEIIAFLKIKLRTDLLYAYRGLERLYNCQTEKEQKQLYSQGHNNLGFNKIDSLILTKIYKNIKKRNSITKVEKQTLLDRMPKYAIQLASLSDPIKLKLEMDKEYKAFIK